MEVKRHQFLKRVLSLAALSRRSTKRLAPTIAPHRSRLSMALPCSARDDDRPTVRTIYREHARFVWLTLQRMGVQPPDLDDVVHDVFVIVHRRLDTFDGSSRVTTWLFGICKRVAANYRRRRHRSPSEATIRASVNDDAPVPTTVDEILVRREESTRARRVVDELSREKRAVFMMFEIEALSCQQIADLTGVPIGTVYSRLHAARAQIERIVSRMLVEEAASGGPFELMQGPPFSTV